MRHLRNFAKYVRCVLFHRKNWQTNYLGLDIVHCPDCDETW